MTFRYSSPSSMGMAEVACATSAIGTGAHIIMAQIAIMAQVAADVLGLPLDNISLDLTTPLSCNRRLKAD